MWHGSKNGVDLLECGTSGNEEKTPAARPAAPQSDAQMEQVVGTPLKRLHIVKYLEGLIMLLVF